MDLQDQEMDLQSYPDLKQSFLLFFILLLLMIIVSVAFAVVILIVMTKTGYDLRAYVWFRSILLVISYSIPIGFVIWYGVRKKRKNDGANLLFSLKVPGSGVFVLMSISAIMIIIISDAIVSLIPMPDFIVDLFMEMFRESTIFTYALIVLIGPILEELLFRGIILDGLLGNLNPRKAILWSSFLFAFIHLNPWQFVYAFALGGLMGWIYYRTFSILSCIYIHVFANLTALILNKIIISQNLEYMTSIDILGNVRNYVLLLVTCAIILYISIRALKKMLPHKFEK